MEMLRCILFSGGTIWRDERGSGRDAYRAECCCIGFSHDSLAAEPCPWIGYVPRPSGAVGIKNKQSRIRFRTQDTLPSSPCGGLTSYSSDSKKFESAWSLTKWDSKVVILMGLKDMEDMVSDRRSKEERQLNWNWIDVLTWRWSGACEVGAEKWVTEFLLFNICI